MSTTRSHDPVHLAQALIRCRSVTPEEGGALTWLAGQLGPVGFACHIPFVTPIVGLFSRYCTPIRTAPINR